MKATHHKIFFVDDEQSMRTTIADTLSKEGYHVTCFANAKACLSEVQHTGCNLLISDVKMPEMDGIQLLSRVKRIAPWVPVILITGYGSIQMAVYATKIGAVEFIEKPFSRAALVNKVKEILSRSAYLSAEALKLTKTEKKILKLILDGFNNKEIAFKMNCAMRTVEFHHTNIYRKFGVDNAVELTKKAMAMLPLNNGN
jgi:two-component system, LuxR family, response regulator FixJ